MPGTPAPALDRLMAKLRFNPATHCVEFTGSLHAHGGYGQFHGGKELPGVIYAHRAAYILWNGPIPDGMQIDHRCENPKCCNPQHLWPVTPKQNIGFARHKMKASSPHAKKTECPRGHPYDRKRPSGERYCSICSNEQSRRAKAKRGVAHAV